ncbi:MAG: hypothetical protein MPJ25_05340 [Pirellulales bacterium]|nr:hypothetical protein [Pirellulales bacterium]
MARISTYTHDAMPHADDNVIGTNQSPGHASETVLFSLSNIEQLFRGNSVHMADIDHGREYDSLTLPLPADFDSSTLPSVTPFEFEIAHNLNTDNLVYDVFVRQPIAGINRFVPLDRLQNLVLRDNTELYQQDNNTLFLRFPDILQRIIARVLIQG